MAIAMTQLGKFYGFPVHVNTGLTDSNVPDAQAGLEKAATMLASALAGAEMFGHLGIAGADQGASLEQLVIDDEICGYVKRILGGFKVNEETLALDLIKNVGFGTFTGSAHTMKHMRKEQWYPQLLNRYDWEKWSSEGSKDLLKKAREAKERILKEYKVEPIDRSVEAEIEAIVKDAFKQIPFHST